MPATTTLFGRLSVQEFLRKYWQKEPLVVRKAFPGLRDPLSPDELAGLACQSDVNSRLVLERGGAKPWQVIGGPQRPATLRRLGKSHWTLLVESVDTHSPAIAALAEAFSFIPRWRMDDVMVSLSPVHGTVDAHIDSYDVFLIQGQGRRRWEVDRRARADYKPGLDLRILQRFRPQDSWVLEPGDMLYVPPGVGHRGVTMPSDVDVALTYSIGFRAPSASDLLSALLARFLSRDTRTLFADPGRKAALDPARIAPADMSALRRFLTASLRTLEGDEGTLAIGEAVTSGGAASASGRRPTAASVALRLRRGKGVSVAPGARLSWAPLRRARAALFVNGESHVLGAGQIFAARFLCGQPSVSSARRVAASPPLLALAVDLLRVGAIEWRRLQAGDSRS